jgi:hypothetical protein
MDDPLTVDLEQLRDLARQAAHAAAVIAAAALPTLEAAALSGSAIAAAVDTADVAARRQAVVAAIEGWAAGAEDTANTLQSADGAAAGRLTR